MVQKEPLEEGPGCGAWRLLWGTAQQRTLTVFRYRQQAEGKEGLELHVMLLRLDLAPPFFWPLIPDDSTSNISGSSKRLLEKVLLRLVDRRGCLSSLSVCRNHGYGVARMCGGRSNEGS